jgi:16S rRNA pseudouridine516 synthase
MARLDFVVSQSLSISKAQAQAKIRAELVRVNGAVVRSPSWQVVLGGVEAVTIGGEPSRPLFHRLLLMHKPAGCVTARPNKRRQAGGRRSDEVAPREEAGQGADDEEEQADQAEVVRTVFDVVPPELAHSSLGPFGRLDKDTTGLLLLGSDGGLQSLLTHPAGEITKQYLATLRPGFPLAPDAAAQVAAGLALADGTQCAPTTMEIVSEGPPTVVKLTLHEGVNHQVKRMIGQVRVLCATCLPCPARPGPAQAVRLRRYPAALLSDPLL